MSDGRVEPVLHDRSHVLGLVRVGSVDAFEVLQTLAWLALSGHGGHLASWKSLWEIANEMGKEVSVLVDKHGSAWVDVGTSGMVRLAPAVGSVAPFRFWLHTHPWDAYASSTDRDTLAACSSILEEAVILGHDHFVHLKKIGLFDVPSLAPTGPLSSWASDKIRTQYLGN